MGRTLWLPKVDRTDPMPKYLQAREILMEAIRSGVLAPGSKLPATKDISALIDISLITAHKALEGLVEKGWLRREVGRGTYVREDLDLAAAARRRLRIALILGRHVNIDDYYHSTIINGLRRESREGAWQAEFFFHDRCDLRERSRRDVGAICIHPPLESQTEVERLSRHCPVVVMGGTFPQLPLSCVDCDNVTGARQAVQHLYRLGHRRFMVLSGPMNLSNARDRAEGAMKELALHGIELARADLPISQDSVVLDDETRARMERRLAEPDRPTAVIAGGFYLALAALQVARAVGLSVPQDVSLVGFDDPPSAPLLDPPLTTVRQPLDEMAARAYRLLCSAIVERSDPGQSLNLPTELVVRESTGPAA